MRINALTSCTIVAVATLALTACSSGSSGNASSSEPQPATSEAASAPAPSVPGARVGSFQGDNGKQVKGTATVANGKIVLSGFSSDQGPDLHLYVTNGTGEGDLPAGKNLGPVVYDKASQTFSLNGVDPSKYGVVVIHCDKAKAVFGHAKLS